SRRSEALRIVNIAVGRNLVVNVRIGVEEQMPELARALVGDKPDVVIAISDWALHATRAATSTIPIVAAPMGVDPVRVGIAESWAHPGGNVTGVSLTAPELEIKRLSLLREACLRCTELQCCPIIARSWKRACCPYARRRPRADLSWSKSGSRARTSMQQRSASCAELAWKHSCSCRRRK